MKYLQDIKTAENGWPIEIAEDEEFKNWLTRRCKETLIARGPTATEQVHEDMLWHKDSLPADELQQLAKLSGEREFIYACIERAMVSISHEAWKLNP